MTERKCENCDYYFEGDCKRYPPTAHFQVVQRVGRIQAGVRPSPPQIIPVMVPVRVTGDDFCGEFSCGRDT